MRLTLSPGFVYIFYSKHRPTDVKIGKAFSTDEREFTLSLGDPDLKLHLRKFFLDVESAEAHMHRTFADKHLVREHFRVSRKKAAAELERLFESRRAERLAYESATRAMVDIGELNLDQSAKVDDCTGSALSVLLNHVPSARDGRSVKTLIPLALSGGSLSPKAMKLLHACGLMAYPVDGIVLLDKSDTSGLEDTFRKKVCQKTWRAQVAKFAGFNETARAVGLQAWLDRTEAGPDVVDRVSPNL
jgi:hypothetical protein